MPIRTQRVALRRVQAAEFRGNYRRMAASARGGRVLLIENRRQPAKYLVDKTYFDALLRDRNAALSTLEVLMDSRLVERLLKLATKVDAGVRRGSLRLYSMDEVFG